MSKAFLPMAMRGWYTLQFLVVRGGHILMAVMGDTKPFSNPVTTNFRAVPCPFMAEGWSVR